MDVTITLGAAEIDEAIREYVAAKSPIALDGELAVELIAGKGTAGHAAIIKLASPVEEKKAPVKKAAPKKAAGKDVTPAPLPDPAVEKTEFEPDMEFPVSDGLREAMNEAGGEEVFNFGGTAISDEVDALFGA